MLKAFLDTNVLAYRFDMGEPAKSARAHELLSNSEALFVVSTQVMLELYVVLTRKLSPPVTPDAAHQALSALSRLEVVPADARQVLSAARTAQRHQLSIWDAMIIEAAVQSGCDEVWTEDLAARSVLRGVRIVNPFEGIEEPLAKLTE